MGDHISDRAASCGSKEEPPLNKLVNCIASNGSELSLVRAALQERGVLHLLDPDAPDDYHCPRHHFFSNVEFRIKKHAEGVHGIFASCGCSPAVLAERRVSWG